MHLLIALLLTMPAVAADDPPRTMEGEARFAGTDRPAAGLTLRVLEREDPKFVVVTDDQGRFRYPVPAGGIVPGDDGDEGLQCWAEAERPGLRTFEAINAPRLRQDPERLRKQVAEALARPVKTTWRRGILRVECPAPGDVEVLVRGPDGTPLADRPVQITPIWPFDEMQGPTTARVAGRTDAEGRFRMRWFPAIRQFQVAIPGLGFGATPKVEVIGGAVSKVETLPLARFGSIQGRVAPKLVGPGIMVRLETTFPDDTNLSAPCDEAGRFEVKDVPPGRYILRLDRNGEGVLSGQVTAWVAPGRKVEGVLIPEAPPVTPEQAAQNERMLERLNGRPGNKDEVWVEGTVKDESGRALAGADVFVRTSYHGGIRMYENVRQTTSDGQGHYSISGPIRGFVQPLLVVAHVKGRPPVVANAPARSTENDRPSKLDLTLARVGGSASVTVLKDGKPMSGASVRLTIEGGATSLSGWARSAQGPERDAFEAVAAPASTADRDGVAHFSDLLPGLYTVYATDQAANEADRRRGILRGFEANTGEAHGLAVAAGREAKTSLDVSIVKHSLSLQVLRPDGRPVADQNVSVNFGLGGETNTGTSLGLDGRGIDEFSFGSAGLWTVVVRFRDTPVNSFPVDQEPYYQAEALIPVSPALRTSGPIKLVGVRREAGSLRVRLLDAEGRPARGVVDFDPFSSREQFAASTDARGEVLYEKMAGKAYHVRGHLESQPPPAFSWGAPFPEDAALRGHFEIVPTAEVTVVAGRETTLELRAKRVGYVRGLLKPPPGRRAADYAVSPGYDPLVHQPAWQLDPASGEFLSGPLLAGPVTFYFHRQMPDGSQQPSGTQVVEVVAGEVTHADLHPGEPEPEDRKAARRQAMLGMGGISVMEGAPENAPVTVFLPDGTTPAFAAQAVLFEPGQIQPVLRGIADASGRLTWHGLWVSGNSEGPDKAGSVQKPTLVVSLPGRHGATIVPLEEGLSKRVILPGPIEAEGTVTVGNRAPSGRDSQIRVVAAFQGRGVLDSALSLSTTLRPDGRFTFAGLTPGRYLVQAARDGIWVSKTVELIAEPGKVPPPLALDIPEPGEPVTLAVFDLAGWPFADQPLTLSRPEGPFAPLWPTTLRTDAAGQLPLWSLEAGNHSVSIPGSTEKAPFSVREAPAAPSTPAVRRIFLQRPGP